MTLLFGFLTDQVKNVNYANKVNLIICPRLDIHRKNLLVFYLLRIYRLTEPWSSYLYLFSAVHPGELLISLFVTRLGVPRVVGAEKNSGQRH